MKINFILPDLQLVPIGGYKIIYQYADYLAGKGHEVLVTHINYFPNSHRSLLMQKKVKEFGKHVLAKMGVRKRSTEFQWYKFTNKVQIEVLETFDESKINDADCVVATAWYTAKKVVDLPKRCGRKYYFIQGYEIWDGPKELVESTWRLPIHKIVIASWLKDIADRLGTDADLVPNFIDTNDFYITQPIESRKQVISVLYHPQSVKGSAFALQALAIVRKQYPRLKVKLFGVTERPKDLDHSYEYFQQPPLATLREHVYNQSAIFLFPSKSEGWGLTATEAMACGCALVAVANGGVQDFGFNNETALITPISDLDGFVQSIIGLLKDDQKRIRLANAGNQLIQEFTLVKSGNKLEKILLA